jgi:hypothetical protein
MEGGVQRSLLHEERTMRDLLDALQHAVPMQGAKRYRLQDEQVERAGKKIRLCHT